MQRRCVRAVFLLIAVTIAAVSTAFAETKRPVPESRRIAEKRQRENECRANNIPLNRCFTKLSTPSPSPSPSPAASMSTPLLDQEDEGAEDEEM
jgi:hypothetical protein